MCQENLNCTDIVSLIVATLSLIVTALAFIVAIASLRAARKTTILSILTERAKEANAIYNSSNRINYISAIVTAQQQLKYSINGFDSLIILNKQYFIDMFYLTLDTSIRRDIWELDENKEIDPTRKKQISVIKFFLEKAKRFDNAPK